MEEERLMEYLTWYTEHWFLGTLLVLIASWTVVASAHGLGKIGRHK